MAALRRAVAAARSLANLSATSPRLRRNLVSSFTAVDHGCWTEWEDDDVVRRRRRDSRVLGDEEMGERASRGVHWVFIGMPGAQKRVYATRVAELLGVPYISMGTLVRQELSAISSRYKKIANAVDEGRLVPEDIIFGLLSRRLEELDRRGETGFILDGMPRTRTQAEILDQIAEIDLVVNFICMEDCLVKKNFGTDICSHCGKAIDTNNLDSTDLNPCLALQSQHSVVISTAAIHMKDKRMEKLQTYYEQNMLLKEYYRKQGKLLDFHASAGQGETWRDLLAALEIQHIDGSPSKKLTV